MKKLKGKKCKKVMLNEIINGYRITEKIKSGGMAAAYKGENQAGFTKAFKVVRPDKAEHNPELHRRFMREIEILRRLNHPNIVRADNVHIHNQATVLEMEFLDGMDFNDLIASKKPSGINDRETLVKISIAILSALDFAHQKNFLHLDIKPSNVFHINEGGFIKLLDFGIAKVVGDVAGKIDGAEELTVVQATGETTFKGTEAYASLEQRMGKPCGITSDIFSFGATLNYIAIGKHVTEQLVDIEPFATVVKKCTQTSKAARFQTCQEIIDFLNHNNSVPAPKPSKKIQCAHCEEMIDTKSNYCPKCGGKILKAEDIENAVKVCPKCHEENDQSYHYCNNCSYNFNQHKPVPAPIIKKCSNSSCPRPQQQYLNSMDKYCNYCGDILIEF